MRNSAGGVSISKKGVHTYTQVDTGQESTTAGVCHHVPDPRWRGIVEPWVCTQDLQGPTRMDQVCMSRLRRNGNTDSKHWGHPSPSVMRKHSEDAVKGCSSAQGRAGTPVAGRSVQHGAPVKDSTGHHRTFCSYADNFLATKPRQLLGLWEWPSCCYLTTFVKSAYKILMKGQIWLDKETNKK